MEKIHSIIKTFSKSEMKYLKHLLTVFHGKGENKLLELVQLIEKNPQISQNEAALKLYQDIKSKAFVMTKGRLIERLYDLVLLTTDLPNSSLVEEDPHASHLANLHKKLSLVIALRKRGLTQIAQNLIEEILKDEMLNCAPNLKIAYLEAYRSSVANIQEFYEINKEINHYMLIAKIDSLALGFLHELKLILQVRSYNASSIYDFLKEKIEVLERELEKVYSPMAYYSYLSLKSTFFENEKRYIECKETLLECISLYDKKLLIVDNNRKAIPYIRLAIVELNLRNYKEAISSSDRIIDLVRHRIYNWASLISVKCYSFLYLGEWAEIDKILAENPIIELKPRNHNEWITNFVVCSKYYVEHDFKKCLLKLGELDVFFENKQTYNPRLRLLEILIYIETQRIDIAIAKLEALRKHLSKYETLPRVQATYKILHQLELQSFNFQTENPQINKMLEELEENTPWSPFSLEAIRFDTWVRAQYNKCNYWAQWKRENPHLFAS